MYYYFYNWPKSSVNIQNTMGIQTWNGSLNISNNLIFLSRGHADAEIEAVFAKYDVDGDRVLDEEECKKMQEDLEGQKVLLKNWICKRIGNFYYCYYL